MEEADKEAIEMSDVQKRALNLKREIEEACIRNRLNLTVHEGSIGFVDQEEMKIVCIWKPGYKIPEGKEG